MDNPNVVFNNQPSMDPLKALLRAKANVIAKQNRPEVQMPEVPNLQSMPDVQTAGASAQLKSPFDQKFRVSQKYGNESTLYRGVTKDSKHHGVDFATPEGTKIKSPIAGDVEVGQNKWYGNYVKIKAPDGTTLQFSHLSNVDDLLKQVEQKRQVLQGQLLGLSGNTGYSTGPHVDVMAWRGGQQIDPMTLSAIKNAAL
jgi:murein DD-endopeptidase MepM/ murein hydrolase activator NlpD